MKKSKSIQNIKYLLLIACFFTGTVAKTQEVRRGEIRGQVTDSSGGPLEHAYVVIDSLNQQTVSDARGRYVLSNIPIGVHKVRVSSLGFKDQWIYVVLNDNTALHSFKMSTHIQSLHEIVVSAGLKTDVQKIEETGFNVNSIDTRPFENSAADVNFILNQTSGVRIREAGGMGSRYNLFLNGLSGRQIRYFIDGVPIDQLGTMYNLNNVPVNLVSRIDVYKGVVPVFLGADALGGAVNITTDKKDDQFIDASYSLGSFNTHRAALSGKYRASKSGFTLKTLNYYNFSKNNYKMDDMTVFVNGNETRQDIRRFHDDYRSYMTNLEVGFTRVKWADELMIGASVGQIAQDVQHGASGSPVGEAVSREDDQVYTARYEKRNLFAGKFDVDAFFLHNRISSTSIDTSSNRYNWLGAIIRTELTALGEFGDEKTLFEYTQQQNLARANGLFRLMPGHTLMLNYITSQTSRQGENRLNKKNDETFRSPNQLRHSVTGLSYEAALWQSKWVSTVSMKYYHLNMLTKNARQFQWGEFEIEDISTRINNWGFSFASRYFITRKWLVKASFEKGYRLPQPAEVFGDGLEIIANPMLKPESGYNTNLGTVFSSGTNERAVRAELSLYLRDMSNFIRFVQVGRFSEYANDFKVLGRGAEFDISYRYNQYLSADANLTYQQLLNNDKYVEGQPGKISRVYRDQMPNMPYFFSNGRISYSNYPVSASFKAGAFYSVNYVHSFYLNYPSISIEKTKNSIPVQIINNVGVVFSSLDDRYHLSIEARNIFDKPAYDEFKLQKPGRAFFLKFRYYLKK